MVRRGVRGGDKGAGRGGKKEEGGGGGSLSTLQDTIT